MNFEAFPRIDEQIVAMMASAPIGRCRCPLQAGLTCSAARCWACYESAVEVAAWTHRNIADVNGQWLSQQYVRRALVGDEVMWNYVRRGLMTQAVAPRPAVSFVVVHASIITDDRSCAICMEDVLQNEEVFLPCMHFYHSACINRWQRRQRTCPACRSPF